MKTILLLAMLTDTTHLDTVHHDKRGDFFVVCKDTVRMDFYYEIKKRLKDGKAKTIKH